MSDEKKVEPVEWAFLLSESNSAEAIVQYRGVTVGRVLSAGLSVEPVPGPDGKPSVQRVLTLRVAPASLSVGTYKTAREPVQQELGL